MLTLKEARNPSYSWTKESPGSGTRQDYCNGCF